MTEACCRPVTPRSWHVCQPPGASQLPLLLAGLPSRSRSWNRSCRGTGASLAGPQASPASAVEAFQSHLKAGAAADRLRRVGTRRDHAGSRIPSPACRRHRRRRRFSRRLAATAGSLECLGAALYIIPALPNVRNAAVFQLVRATYIDTVKRLAPAGGSAEGCRLVG